MAPGGTSMVAFIHKPIGVNIVVVFLRRESKSNQYILLFYMIRSQNQQQSVDPEGSCGPCAQILMDFWEQIEF